MTEHAVVVIIPCILVVNLVVVYNTTLTSSVEADLHKYWFLVQVRSTYRRYTLQMEQIKGKNIKWLSDVLVHHTPPEQLQCSLTLVVSTGGMNIILPKNIP